MHKSMSLKHEPPSELLHISAKWFFLNCVLGHQRKVMPLVEVMSPMTLLTNLEP